MGSTSKEVIQVVLPHIRVYKDGSVERLADSPYVPSSPEDPETGVSSKDITISQNPLISARLFLPKLTQPNQKLPILVFIHGGAFCFESAFSSNQHRYMNSLVSQAQVVAVSVEYRLAPEHLLPVAYEDCWTALQWVASHANAIHEEPWLVEHGIFEKLHITGDSAGANIVHNILMRAGVEVLPGGVKTSKAVLTHPYFWSSKPVLAEPVDEHDKAAPHVLWNLVYPSAPSGVDNPLINPIVHGVQSLTGLGCDQMLVTVAECDELLRERGIWYFNAMKESGWKGEMELIEVEGVGHAFQILDRKTDKAKDFIKRLALFLQD
ncbi:2-hydroxyisoflavanone dehydratase-like [Quillaja saponaria]|uniref:2-hydroxyisoflavanone dehydratase-like n=1 Tax=Quillaja saponaria TaxID=32244 RepID=A0AAD7PHE6_QUISA|nr:2-hydroxyisoflavanone dehydratase-like [Quillaja saponaria]